MVRPSRFNTSKPVPRTSDTLSVPTEPTDEEQADTVQAQVEGPTPATQQTTSSAVKGPTSALTSFLKEQGIRHRHLNPYARRDQSQPSTSAIPEEANEEVLEELEEEEEQEVEAEDEVDSDDLDGEPSTKTRSRQPTTKKAQISIPKRVAPNKSSTRVETGPSKPEKGSPDPPSRPKPGKYADRKPGMIATCECGKRFTVTRYTPSEPGRGQLCDTCSKEGFGKKSDAKDGPPATKKRKTKKNQPVKSIWSEHTTQTLQMACISVVAKHIESLDGLGCVGSVNLEKICKIVCKHRELKPINLPLFLDISHTHLKLFDCIHLEKDSLLSLATFCPRLQHLTLNLCGHLDGEVLTTYGRRLRHLRELDLFGPYLVRCEAWLELFSIWSKPSTIQTIDIDMENDKSEDSLEDGPRGPQISVFRLKQSPRFNLDCIRALADTCRNLSVLRLDDIGLLDDQGLEVLANAKFKNLTKLSIANAGILNGATGESLTDYGVIRLLESLGSDLEEVDISQNKRLTDQVLSKGLANHCRCVTKLNIGGLQELTSKGIQELFDTWKEVQASKLDTLNLSRCIRVDNDGLFSILDHTGPTLKYLDLNSVDELRSEALERLSKEASSLIELDLSFVRDVDDFLIKACLDHMRNLKTIYVYGNNRVSDLCPNRKGVAIKGQERAIVVV
ncbi:hypothetical protein CROQUDRAFT_660863 [Cronartium quercuum f. sp. fusiforme G11]|uniref:DNA repair protein rhp7 treble clef domain-containing protein n=1 Tax=Cronartium quercuum f. sp. fusiforme G11 TaxID=708437 RepID=A0A9P6NGI3_9BASI|nr:hypothetical protein CROQUDRAFT_660863 [Cronartium quercuum f. sp. fusiforme G11]